MQNKISFRVFGRYGLFTDPVTRIGGEKCTYPVPTYEAIKGILKSIYWKPTIIWVPDRIRIMNPIRTQIKGTKPLSWSGGSSLSIYNFLENPEYQIEAHFIFNEHRPELAEDRIDGKHYAIAQRSLEKGGRQDIFLGTRDCQGYVEPCSFGDGEGAYDSVSEVDFGVMFHSFLYSDETGTKDLKAVFWAATMKDGIIEFPPATSPEMLHKFIRKMTPKTFDLKTNQKSVEEESIII